MIWYGRNLRCDVHVWIWRAWDLRACHINFESTRFYASHEGLITTKPRRRGSLKFRHHWPLTTRTARSSFPLFFESTVSKGWCQICRWKRIPLPLLYFEATEKFLIPFIRTKLRSIGEYSIFLSAVKCPVRYLDVVVIDKEFLRQSHTWLTRA